MLFTEISAESNSASFSNLQGQESLQYTPLRNWHCLICNVLLFVLLGKGILNFEFVDEILKCDHVAKAELKMKHLPTYVCPKNQTQLYFFFLEANESSLLSSRSRILTMHTLWSLAVCCLSLCGGICSPWPGDSFCPSVDEILKCDHSYESY